jgi:hypothetical protein
MRYLDTGFRPVFSSKQTSGNGNPCVVTEAIPTTGIYTFRAAVGMFSATPNMAIRLYYERSDDGVNWPGTTRTAIGTFVSPSPWAYNEAGSSAVDTDVGNFVRFGLQGRNTTGTAIERCLARLKMEVDEVHGRTMTAPLQMVWCNGTDTAVFHPLQGLGPVQYQDFNQHRATLQVESCLDANVQPAFQVSNDGVNWYSGVASSAAGTFMTFSTAREAYGIYYDGSFASFATSEKKQLVRWGVAVKRKVGSGASLAESAMAALRIDVRKT